MKRILGLTLVAMCASVSSSQTRQAPQSITGRISDSICGASHQPKAGSLTERQCIYMCLKALASWVLVAPDTSVLAIANQELSGLPLYAGRPVRLTGERQGDTLVASRIEAYPPHLHIGHVMTNWRDTPGGVGFLSAAASDARVAATHANLAAKNPDNLEEVKLHAGHVLHALDPSLEPKGPASGYGVKKAAAAAQQHLDFAVKAEGASNDVKSHAVHVAAALGDAAQWTEDAIGVAQKIRDAATAAEAAPLVAHLSILAAKIVDGALAPAQAQMILILKAEGLEHAPR